MNREFLYDLIAHNADRIETMEKKSRIDAEYLALCLVLDDLTQRPSGANGYRLVMDILFNEYSKHQNDVLTYLAVRYEGVKLKPEYEKKLWDRHR